MRLLLKSSAWLLVPASEELEMSSSNIREALLLPEDFEESKSEKLDPRSSRHLAT